MDYTHVPTLHGADFLKKNVVIEAEQFKVNFLKERIQKVRLLDNGTRHVGFLENCSDRLQKGNPLTDNQVPYLDSLFDQILEGEE